QLQDLEPGRVAQDPEEASRGGRIGRSQNCGIHIWQAGYHVHRPIRKGPARLPAGETRMPSNSTVDRYADAIAQATPPLTARQLDLLLAATGPCWQGGRRRSPPSQPVLAGPGTKQPPSCAIGRARATTRTAG